MEPFTTKKFNIGELKGISSKIIEQHLKLYEGYVKHSNLTMEKIRELENDPTANALILGELHKHFAFEFDGMRNHEYYFEHLSDGYQDINQDGELYKAIEKEWGSFEDWLTSFQSMALTRGVGWVILYYDYKTGKLINHWVEEHQMGQLTGLCPLLCFDVWEHAYINDYAPSEKSKYVEAFFDNLNWETVENNFNEAI